MNILFPFSFLYTYDIYHVRTYTFSRSSYSQIPVKYIYTWNSMIKWKKNNKLTFVDPSDISELSLPLCIDDESESHRTRARAILG